MTRKLHWLALLVLVLVLAVGRGYTGRAWADDGNDGSASASQGGGNDDQGSGTGSPDAPVVDYSPEEDTIQETVGPFVDAVIIPAFASISRLDVASINGEIQQGKSLSIIGGERGLYGEPLRTAFLAAAQKQVGTSIPSDQQSEIGGIIKKNVADILDATYLNDTAQAIGPAAPAAVSNSGPKRHLNVVATTVQITALAQAVGGDLIDLTGIIPAGADPHEFEPVASDLIAISKANVILKHGIGLDDWMEDTLSTGTSAQVTTVTKGVRLRQGDEDGKLVNDPHVWHDPANDERIVDNIAGALAAADPGDATAFYNNASAYKQILERTKTQVQAIINTIPPENRKLVTNHDALSYFANAFGLKVVGAVIPSLSTESEPSAKETAELLDTIRQQKVKAIFAESSVDPRLAKQLAKDAGVRVVLGLYADSMGDPGSGGDTIDGMLLANAYKIADALK